MEDIPKWMQDHIADDAAFQHKMANEIIPTLATKDDLKGLATEKSVRELIHWQKSLIMAGEIIRGGGKWSYRAMLILAGLIGAIVTITGGWKYLISLFFMKS